MAAFRFDQYQGVFDVVAELVELGCCEAVLRTSEKQLQFRRLP